MDKYKITQKHFKKFKRYCKKWQKKLNLMSWKIYYDMEEDTENFATFTANYNGRVAKINLSKEFPEKPTDELLEEKAKHEILEVLLSPLWSQAKSRVWDGVEYEKENHTIIRILEKLL